MAFDSAGDIWGVNDISTDQQNGWSGGLTPVQRTISHVAQGSTPSLVGVFGNNAIFCCRLAGDEAGVLQPFGYGPVSCEMTGPTFVHDTLILSVQHPGENVPIGDGATTLVRDIECLNLDGTIFTQTRTVPLGSRWPHDDTGVPRPTVIGIKPKSA